MGTGSPVSGADGHVAAPRALVGMEPESQQRKISLACVDLRGRTFRDRSGTIYGYALLLITRTGTVF